MKLPVAWLRDYLDFDLSSDALAERFAMLGFPVENIERRPKLSGVVIGKLTSIEKHPGADRLQVCTVDIGAEAPLTIATAATNVAVGQVVPVAKIGAQLAGLQIGPRKMRGIDSQGMLCSADELALPPEWFDDGILQLETSLPVGADFIETFRLNDDVLDVEIVANRVDAMSVLGLARELAAALRASVVPPPVAFERIAPATQGDARITLESGDCRRFVAQRFSNVRVGTSPFWMRVRLALAGQRPLNNLVDISNFVMLEGAQPLHFYDFERLAGGHLSVRDAREGEVLRTLDEEDRKLDPRFLVVADEREAQGIAGLRGGAGSEVSAATRELLVEAAIFSGPRVRRMSAILGVRTEASSRHEKGLPLGLSTWGAARAAHLLTQGGATAQAPFAMGEDDAEQPAIAVGLERFPALLGIAISEGEAESALRGLGFGARTIALEARGESTAERRLEVTPPGWRGDVAIAEDVVEEVARIVGYDCIVAEMPVVFEQTVSSAEYARECDVAHALAALGYHEAVTLALQPGGVAQTFERAGIELPGPVVEIRNPLSEDQRYLRFSLLPGLLALYARHADQRPYRAFEVAHTFAGGPDPSETPGAAWLLALERDDEAAWRDGGFLEFKSDSLALVRRLTGRDAEVSTSTHAALHPGKTAALLLDGVCVATIGSVDPRLCAAFDLGNRVYAGFLRFADIPPHRVPRYEPPSKYPPVARDLALVVATGVSAGAIEEAVRAGAGGVAREVRVFDEYRGPQVPSGRKSIAVRVVLQSREKTLTDADADRAVAGILGSLRERCDATLRT